MEENNQSDDRAVVAATLALCRKKGISCTAFSDNWVIRLRKGDRTHFIYAARFDHNSQASAAIAKDKVATYVLLRDADVLAIPHYLLATREQGSFDRDRVEAMLHEHGSVVVKPLLGSRGEHVARFSDVSDIIHFMDGIAEPSWTISPFVDIEHELRLVVFKGSIVFAYDKYEPVIRDGLKMFNLTQGAKARLVDSRTLPSSLHVMAARAMAALGLKLGAVDVAVTRNGQMQVIEINSGFSLQHFAGSSAEGRDRVLAFYESIIDDLFAS